MAMAAPVRAQVGEVDQSPAPPRIQPAAGIHPPRLTMASPGAASAVLPFGVPGKLQTQSVPGMPTVTLTVPLGFSVPNTAVGAVPLSHDQLMMDQPAVRLLAPNLVPVAGFQWGMVRADGSVSTAPVSLSGGPAADISLPPGSPMPLGIAAVYLVTDDALELLPNVGAQLLAATTGPDPQPVRIELTGLTTTGEIEMAICQNGCGSHGFLPGDVDGDGKVTVADAQRALQALVGLRTLSRLELATADLNGNGKLDVGDIIDILRLSLALPILGH